MRRLSFAAAVLPALLVAAAVVASVPPALSAQDVAYRTLSKESGDRAALGVSTASGSARDTIGVLISDVTVGGPADKAGIQEGDRIASIGDVDLRVAAADAGSREMQGIMARRLAHALAKHAPGDVVELRVYHDGQFVPRKVTTGKASEVFVMPATYHTFGGFDDGGLKFEHMHEDMAHMHDDMGHLMDRVRIMRMPPLDSNAFQIQFNTGPHRI